MSRARSSRASAVRARSLFKELENEDEDGVKHSLRSRKRKRSEDHDEEFDVSKAQDETSDTEIPDENDDRIVPSPVCEEEDDEPEDAPDSNEIQKRRTILLDLWSDFIEIPKTELREIPPEVKNRWKKTQKRFTCPENGCKKSFTTLPGIVYHYKRCGTSPAVGSENVKCKLCSETATLPKKLLYHLFNHHLTELPPPPEELTVGLAEKTRTPRPRSHRSSRVRERPFLKTNYLDSTLQYRQTNEGKNLFPNHLPLRSQWRPMSSQQSDTYLPLSETSVNLKVHGEKKWRRLMRFESISNGCHKTFFTGGPVFTAAWLPVPTGDSDDLDQILCLSVGLNFEDTHAYSDQDAEFGVLQFWNFGRMSNKLQESSNVDPRLCFCIALADGIVWDMEWCPFGNTWMSPSSKVHADHFPRMGLLSLACGNGVVKILSVPHLQFVSMPQSSSPPIYTPSPVMILDPPGIGPLTNHEPSICKCISWSRTNGSRNIAAGFGSGVIAVWNLETKSPFLKSEESTRDCDIFLPMHSFSAHGTAVTGLCWCPHEGSAILVSGSGLDRDLIFWDLSDPQFTHRAKIGKKMHATSLEWPFRWNGVFVSQDAGFSNLIASVVFVDPLSKDKPTYTTCQHKSTVWSASYNEWCNVEASGDASGEVVAFCGFDDVMNHKRKYNYRLPIYRVQPAPLLGQSDQNDNNRTLCYTYDSICERFGIEYHDIDLSRKVNADHVSRIRSSETMNWDHPSNYPLVSVNHVAWNPNKNSHTWLFTGTQSGVCRISCVSVLLKQNNS